MEQDINRRDWLEKIFSHCVNCLCSADVFFSPPGAGAVQFHIVPIVNSCYYFSSCRSPFQNVLAYIYTLKCFTQTSLCHFQSFLSSIKVFDTLSIDMGNRQGSSLILQHTGIQLSQHHLLERLKCIFLTPLCRPKMDF